MLIKILATIILSVLSGLFYRFGGMGKEEKSWVPMFLRKSWMRDKILPLFSFGVIFIWWKPNARWGYLLALPSYPLIMGALSTYWDFLTKLWRGDESEYWENWFLHGFFVGLSTFPFIFAGLSWWVVLINAIISGLLMMLVSELSSNVWVEEIGRGVIATISRLLVLIK